MKQVLSVSFTSQASQLLLLSFSFSISAICYRSEMNVVVIGSREAIDRRFFEIIVNLF